MKRLILALFILVSVSIPLLIGFYWINRPKGYIEKPTEVDTSWVGKVNDSLKEAGTYPLNNNSYYLLAFTRVLLYENGTEQLVNVTGESSESSEFIAYLENLLSQVNALKNASVTREFAEKVVGTDKVVMMSYRFPETFRLWDNLDSACFILEDKLNEDLAGSILVREVNEEDQFSIWAIAK